MPRKSPFLQTLDARLNSHAFCGHLGKYLTKIRGGASCTPLLNPPLDPSTVGQNVGVSILLYRVRLSLGMHHVYLQNWFVNFP